MKSFLLCLSFITVLNTAFAQQAKDEYQKQDPNELIGDLLKSKNCAVRAIKTIIFNLNSQVAEVGQIKIIAKDTLVEPSTSLRILKGNSYEIIDTKPFEYSSAISVNRTNSATINYVNYKNSTEIMKNKTLDEFEKDSDDSLTIVCKEPRIKDI